MSENKILFGDCLVLLSDIPNKSIDLILADLPFQKTKNKWDRKIPLLDYIEIVGKRKKVQQLNHDQFMIWCYKQGISLDECIERWNIEHKKGLWYHYERIIKDNGAILLFGQDKFSAELMCSNPKLHRYNLIYEKTTATGHLNANEAPMRAHEDILVFYKQLPTYNPQKTYGHVRKVSTASHKRNSKKTTNYGEHGLTSYDSTERYPRSVIKFKTDKQRSKLHATQKPLALIEYLIKTYSNEGDLVLDNVAGSGTTGEAAENLGRKYILMENDPQSFETIKQRLNIQ